MMPDDARTADPRLRVPAEPYDWPPLGPVAVARVALIVTGCQQGVMQRLAAHGRARAAAEAVGAIDELLHAARNAQLRIVHARQSERPELAATAATGAAAAIDEPSPARESARVRFIGGCAPRAGEITVDHPGRDAFYATDLELVLATCGITHLILAGFCLDGTLHSTLRSANDRGLDGLVARDAVAASDARYAEAALSFTTMQSGIFGAAADTAAIVAALERRAAA